MADIGEMLANTLPPEAIDELTADRWEVPQPLRAAMSPPEFPTSALPDFGRAFVEAVAEATQTPSAMAGSLFLAVAGAAVAGRVEIQGRPGWTEGLNIYTAVAMDPGSRKSQVMADMTKPLADYEKSQSERLVSEVAASESEWRRMKKRLDGLENKYANAASDEQRDRLKDEANRLAKELSAYEVKRLPRILAQDVTAERTATLMADNDGRIAIFSAEGELFQIIAGRYSGGSPNMEVYLKGHAGDLMRVDRQNKESKPVFIERPALTIGLCVQPDVLRELPSVKGLQGRGLLARFLWVVPPSNIGRRKTKTDPVTLKVAADYSSGIRRLLELQANTDQNGKAIPWTITLDADASTALDALLEAVEKSLGNPDEMGAYKEWGSKFVGAVLRIAGILHCCKKPGVIGALLEPLAKETLMQAMEIGDFYHAHAKAAFGLMGTDSTVDQAEYILEWLKKHDYSRIRKSELQQGLRGRFPRAAMLDEPLALLTEYGWLRQTAEESTGTHKPTTWFEINPA